MSINKRRLDILREVIIKSNVDLWNISEEFKVSGRTIRNDILQINQHLKTFSLNEIIIKDNRTNFDNIGIFSDALKTVNLSNYIMSTEERIILEVYILLISKDYITTNHISDLLMVSKSSVFNDIDMVNIYLNENNLSLESSPGKGLLIKGDESNFRNSFCEIIDSHYYLINIFENTNFNDCLLDSYLESKKYIYEVIGRIEHNYNIIFSEESFRRLYNYILYMTYRIKNRRYLSDVEVSNIFNKISKDIVRFLVEKYKIKINNSELERVNRLIKTLDYKYVGHQFTNTIESQFLTRYIIDYVSEQINVPLFMDYQLYESLAFHIERIKNNNYNGEHIDYDKQIMDLVVNNKKLYNVVYASVENSDDFFKDSITDNEIYYIMIYLYISIERILNQIIKDLNIVIVCNSGIGTSQLMSLKLKDLFGFKNIDIITSRQLTDYYVNSSDLMLSTVSLPLARSDYVKVSPVITSKEASVITSLIFDISHKKLKEIKNVQNSNIIFNDLEKSNVEDIYVKGIDYFLNRDTIVLDAEVSDWKESIRFAGNILVERNKIKKDYIDDMIKNIEEYGPYIVIKKGVALPHAAISKNVIETSFLLVRLKNPVAYGAQKLDPIKYVCILAVSDEKDHIKALFDFNNLMTSEDFMNQLESANTSVEVEELIRRFKKDKYKDGI